MSKQLTPIEDIRNNLKVMEPQFKAALPPHISVDKFLRVAMTAIQTSPILLQKNRQSLFASCMKASQDGLLPDGKESALVPYKDNVQYIPMVAGILKKIRNSGELSSITSQIVHEKDSFRYWIDSEGEHLEHTPNIFSDRGNPIGVYALAKTKDNSVYIEVMTLDQINKVKKMSKALESGPWSGPFEHEMWKKTAIRRLSKRLPMSTDLETVIRRDDELYEIESPQVETTETQVETPRLNKLILDSKPVETVDQNEPKENEPI